MINRFLILEKAFLIAGATLGIIIAAPTIQLPAYTGIGYIMSHWGIDLTVVQRLQPYSLSYFINDIRFGNRLLL